MLAKTFKTAKELKIPDNVHTALIEVYWMLSNGTIPDHLFDMSTIGRPVYTKKGHACGSAGCIIGWCNALDRRIETFFTDNPIMHNAQGDRTGLGDLCYPDFLEAMEASGPQAIAALHNYLTTGHPSWRKALGEATATD